MVKDSIKYHKLVVVTFVSTETIPQNKKANQIRFLSNFALYVHWLRKMSDAYFFAEMKLCWDTLSLKKLEQ